MNQLVDTNSLSARLAALSEPVRLRICRLLERQELSVGEVARVVQLPQSTVSRQLKVLSGEGWLVRRTEGTATLYRLIQDDLEAGARRLWSAVRDQMGDDRQLDDDLRRLDGVLAERRTDSSTFFGQVAGDWDRVRSDLFGRHFTGDALLGLLPRSWRVADLGCGTGNAAELVAPYVREVIAVDRTDAMLAGARERLASFTNIRFVAGEIERLPLEDASVDAAICLLVLHHVTDPAPALREMRRVIRPGGIGLIVDMYAHDRTMYRHSMGHVHLGFSEDEMARLFVEAGFETPTITSLPSDPNAKGPGLFVASAAASMDSGREVSETVTDRKDSRSLT